MAFFPMWPACYVIFLLIQYGVVTGAEGACTRLDETNGTMVSCNWQNNICDSTSRYMNTSLPPDWWCFALCASGPWSMIYILTNETVTLKSPWLCPTGLDKYTLSFYFQEPQDLLPEQLQLFVLKGAESNFVSSQANFSSIRSLSTGTWFANVSVFCPDCNFQIIFKSSLPGIVSLQNISLTYEGPRQPDILTTDKFYAMWIAGIVILLVAAVVAVACFIFWWRKKRRACGPPPNRADGAVGVEVTTVAALGETDSGRGSGGSAATAGIAVSGNGSAGSVAHTGQQETKKGDNSPGLQRDGVMPSPSHGISATPKPSPVSEENGENYDYPYYGDSPDKYDNQRYLKPIADPHAKPEPVESPPLPYRPPDLRRK